MSGMRTTIDIPDVLYKSVRSRCALEGTTLRHVTIALYGDWMQRPDWRPRVRTEYIATGEQPQPEPEVKRRLTFLGAGRKGANLNVSHDWNDIQESIGKGWAAEFEEKERRIAKQQGSRKQ